MDKGEKDLPKPQTDLPLPEKELPKPETDLPKPEKEITEKSSSASQGEALEPATKNQTSTEKPRPQMPEQSDGEQAKRKLPVEKMLVAGIVILITLLAFGLIAYLMMEQNKSPQVSKTAEITPASNAAVADPTADWNAYKTDCEFSIKYPKTWSAEKYFIVDSDQECVYITAPDHELILDSREGFYIHVTRIKLGSLGGINEKFPINSLEDFIKDEESINTPQNPVIQKANEAYGSINGISYTGVGFDPGRSFIFERDTYIYKTNWPEDLEEQYSEEIKNIINSIKFTDTETTADTSGWKTYSNSDRGFSFNYPNAYGEVINNNDSVNFYFSNQPGISFRTNYDHEEGRPSNLYADFYGYKVQNDEYIVNWASVEEKMTPVKTITTTNTEAIIVDDAKRGFGNEDKEILALINNADNKYTGLVFINGFNYEDGFSTPIPNSEFEEIIKSIEIL